MKEDVKKKPVFAQQLGKRMTDAADEALFNVEEKLQPMIIEGLHQIYDGTLSGDEQERIFYDEFAPHIAPIIGRLEHHIEQGKQLATRAANNKQTTKTGKNGKS